ncbi:hypothetical protein SGPA1_21882 [Streptomyces misionensis JCM 4497]
MHGGGEQCLQHADLIGAEGTAAAQYEGTGRPAVLHGRRVPRRGAANHRGTRRAGGTTCGGSGTTPTAPARSASRGRAPAWSGMDDVAHVVERAAAGFQSALALLRERHAQFLTPLHRHVLARAVEDGAFLLVGVVGDGFHQRLQLGVPLLGAHLLHLQEVQQCLVALVVLVLAVLDLFVVDVLVALQGGIDLGLLGQRVGDQQVRELPQRGGPVGLDAAHQAEQILHAPVVLKDELDDVPGLGHGRAPLSCERLGHYRLPWPSALMASGFRGHPEVGEPLRLPSAEGAGRSTGSRPPSEIHGNGGREPGHKGRCSYQVVRGDEGDSRC